MSANVRISTPGTNGTSRVSSLETDMYGESEAPMNRPFNWPLLQARIAYWFWVLFTKSLVTFVYIAIISQGLRYVLPEMGMKLYKIPGFAFLQNYKATYRLDLAYVFSVVPLISAWILWHFNLLAFLSPKRFEGMAAVLGWEPDRFQRVVQVLGAIIIMADCALFYSAFVLVSWGGSKFSAGALLATVAYAAVLGFVTFVSQYLNEIVNSLKEKEPK